MNNWNTEISNIEIELWNIEISLPVLQFIFITLYFSVKPFIHTYQHTNRPIYAAIYLSIFFIPICACLRVRANNGEYYVRKLLSKNI